MHVFCGPFLCLQLALGVELVIVTMHMRIIDVPSRAERHGFAFGSAGVWCDGEGSAPLPCRDALADLSVLALPLCSFVSSVVKGFGFQSRRFLAVLAILAILFDPRPSA